MTSERKILYLCPSLSRKMGGIYEITRNLSRDMMKLGFAVEAYGLKDDAWVLDLNSWGNVPVHAFECIGPKYFGYSKKMKDAVLGSDAELLHIHALWMYTSLVASHWKNQKKRPYIVTPNGMLESWALCNSGWKKRIAALLYENRMLRNAFCLQANTEKELNDFRSYGLRNPVAIIPNGVDLPEDEFETSHPKKIKHAVKTLLFLGRIHPKKGLIDAIRGWSLAKKQNRNSWRFVIAGWDQDGHLAELIKICQDLDLSYFVGGENLITGVTEKSPAEIIFAGEVFGEIKKDLFRLADAFILPSLSEGLPMSVLEAWSYSLPVLMTPECNLCEGFSAEAAIKIKPDVRSIGEGLRELFLMNTPDLCTMGKRGHQLVRKSFTWTKVAEQMAGVYSWIRGGGSVPDCVIKNSNNPIYVAAG